MGSGTTSTTPRMGGHFARSLAVLCVIADRQYCQKLGLQWAVSVNSEGRVQPSSRSKVMTAEIHSAKSRALSGITAVVVVVTRQDEDSKYQNCYGDRRRKGKLQLSLISTESSSSPWQTHRMPITSAGVLTFWWTM